MKKTTITQTTPPKLSARRQTELIFLIGLFAAVGPITIDTYLPAMPAIGAELSASAALVQLSISTYFIGLATGMIFAGPLSDRFGRKTLLFFGFSLYLLASVLCALAPDIQALGFFRMLQGLGASASWAAGLAVIRDIWSGDRAARAMSFVIMVLNFAPLVAPLAGGQISAWLGWRAVFWVMAAFAIVIIGLISFRLPETHGRQKRAGVRLRDPFLGYLKVIFNPRFWGYLLCGAGAYAVLFTFVTAGPWLYIELFGVAPQMFGFYFAFGAIGIILGNFINGHLVTRFGHLNMTLAGTLITSTASLTLLVLSLAGNAGLAAVMLTTFFALGAVGMIGSNSISAAMNLFPKNAGAVSALFGVIQFTAGALGGIIASALYDDSPLAMAVVMSLAALLALLASLVVRKQARQTSGISQ